METADRLNNALAGKWLGVCQDDRFAPMRIERVVDGEVDDFTALLSSGEPASGAKLFDVISEDVFFFDERPACLEYCDRQNTIEPESGDDDEDEDAGGGQV